MSPGGLRDLLPLPHYDLRSCNIDETRACEIEAEVSHDAESLLDWEEVLVARWRRSCVDATLHTPSQAPRQSVGTPLEARSNGVLPKVHLLLGAVVLKSHLRL